MRKAHVEPRTLLVHFLREHLNLTGTHVGCDTSQCGACTVLVDGRSAKSCTIFAVQADGSSVTTIEGLAPEGQLHPVQEGFWEEHGLQCGYCTPGMIMSAVNLLQDNPVAERDSRFATASPATSAAAPATSTSSTRFSTPRSTAAEGGEVAMATATPVLPKLVGERVKRREDPRLIQGRGTYVDDLKIDRHAAPGVQAQRHRARHASRRSTPAPPRRWTASKRSSPAPRSPKVLGADADRHAVPVAAASRGRGRRRPLRRRAGRRRRRQPIATWRATPPTRSSSSYDPLPAVVDPEAAMTGKPASIHEDFPNNLAVALVPSGTGVAPDGSTIDDTAVDKAFAEAEVVIASAW